MRVDAVAGPSRVWRALTEGTDCRVGAVAEVEDTWLPVLDALRRRLDRGER
ncbi:hypothetical protein [Pseudonocardia sp.]|jgi:hypothetical protein|uniref:hypothetical protein n=1 Tax=Pseudonocardia sp. TaxID=60912 RepID=UPI002628B93B|nr:hypothetical protein [Pseudonocardia sp.]